jgi:hypothetical protein
VQASLNYVKSYFVLGIGIDNYNCDRQQAINRDGNKSGATKNI